MNQLKVGHLLGARAPLAPCTPDPGCGGTACTDVVRQVGPGLAVAEPLPAPLCRMTSLGGEGKELSPIPPGKPPFHVNPGGAQEPLLPVLGQRCRDGTWPTVQQNANVPSPPLSLADKCHSPVSSVLQALCLSPVTCGLGVI